MKSLSPIGEPPYKEFLPEPPKKYMSIKPTLKTKKQIQQLKKYLTRPVKIKDNNILEDI